MNRHLITATAVVIFGIPTIFFLFYGMYGPMWEYQMTCLSDLNPGLRGFLYPWDSLRIHATFFFHLGYLISNFVGQTGGWIGYHVLYCALFTIKGLLIFSLCRLLDLNRKLAALAAVISVLHGADGSHGYAGAVAAFGIPVWILLSMCSFLLFLRQINVLWVIWLCAAAIFSYIALWTYEATLLGLLLYPFFFVWVKKLTKDPLAQGGAFFTIIPALIYSALYIKRALTLEFSNTYQATVMRSDIFNFGVLAHDFFVLVVRLFNVPAWIYKRDILQAGFSLIKPSLVMALFILVYFAILLGMTAYRSATNPISRTEPDSNGSFRLICTLCGLTVLFLLPFMILELSYWRTQILSAPFASILQAMLIEYVFISLFTYLRMPIMARCALYAIAVLSLLSAGFVSITTQYQKVNVMWESTRSSFERLLQTIPAVRSGTIIMLQNVPLGGMSECNYFFDKLLRLCYPHTKVAGSYSFAFTNQPLPVVNHNGQIVTLENAKSILLPKGPGPFYSINGEQVMLIGKGKYVGSNPLIESASIGDVIVLEWTDKGPFKIVYDANQIDVASLPDVANYSPNVRINAKESPSPLALRRFAPLLFQDSSANSNISKH